MPHKRQRLQKEWVYEDGAGKRKNVSRMLKFSDESLSNSSEGLNESSENEDMRDSLELLATIFTDTDDSEKEFEGFPNEDLCQTKFTQKTIQSGYDIQYENAMTCCADRDTRENKNSKRWCGKEWESFSSDESSVVNEENMSGLSEILSTIFTDTDDNDADFEGFPNEELCKTKFTEKTIQSGNDIHYENGIACYADRDTRENKNSKRWCTNEWESSSSDESSVVSEENMSGLPGILSNIFTDTDDSDGDFEGFPNEDLCQTKFTQKTIHSGYDIQYENAIDCCADRDTRENKNSKRWRENEWESSSLTTDDSSEENMSGLPEILCNIFSDTDDSDGDFEGFPNEDLCKTKFTQKTNQSGNDMQYENTITCADIHNRENKNRKRWCADKWESNSSDESSVVSEENLSGLPEILSNIFTDTDDSDGDFEGFPNEEFCKTKFMQKTNQSDNDIQYENAITCYADRDTRENKNSKGWRENEWESSSSDESSIVSEENMSGLPEILSNIFTDTDDSDGDFEGFIDDETEEMHIADETWGTSAKIRSEENSIKSASAANRISEELFSSCSSDEEIGKLKETIVKYIKVLESLDSSDGETEDLTKKKRKCHSHVEDNHYDVRILKNERKRCRNVSKDNGDTKVNS